MEQLVDPLTVWMIVENVTAVVDTLGPNVMNVFQAGFGYQEQELAQVKVVNDPIVTNPNVADPQPHISEMVDPKDFFHR